MQDAELLLPCNVVLRGTAEGTEVSVADPGALVEMAGEDLDGVAGEARERLSRVVARLRG